MKDRKTLERERKMDEYAKENRLAMAERLRKKGKKLMQEKRFEEADKHFKEADKLVKMANGEYDPKAEKQKKKVAGFFGALADHED